MSIDQSDFASGGLQRASYARPGKLFTANTSLFAAAVGTVAQARLDEIRNVLVAIIQGGTGRP